MKMLTEVGERSIPFTTGILVGIETREERVDSLIKEMVL
jgi:2-iminoacetate synthase ThiH